jgi:hypothetical protein
VLEGTLPEIIADAKNSPLRVAQLLTDIVTAEYVRWGSNEVS